MKRVLLVSMPFQSISYPAIGISLLKARLSEEGIPCDVKYFNMNFAEMIGITRHEEIFKEQSWRLMFGEWLFAQAFFGEDLPAESEYREYITQFLPGLRTRMDELFSIKELIDCFLNQCLNTVDWEAYEIVGFSTMFEQNMASVALAHRIKRLYPEVTIVFGGANCEGEMGLELHRQFPFIDYVCSGEADFSFPELVRRISDRQPIEDIEGVVYRKHGRSIEIRGVTAVENLDALPYPDYDDYFFQLRSASIPPSTCVGVEMETSRGCWWGERVQCRFCGLNGRSISFRSKSQERVIDELCYVNERYVEPHDLPWIYMVDNVLDMRFFRGPLLELSRMGLPVQIFYETRSSLSKEQVQVLAEAGVYCIQPGIESLSTQVLRLMTKGVSALHNVQLLKHCQRFGVHPGWSLLTGFPGEQMNAYRQMIDLMGKLTHLQPPEVKAPFELDRFSPYFEAPEAYGIINVQPGRAYRFIYPFDDAALFNLAYHFEFEYKDDVRPPDYDADLQEALDHWQNCYVKGEYLCSSQVSPFVLFIQDGRSSAVSPRLFLAFVEKDIYEYCDSIRSFHSIVSHLRDKYPYHPVRARDVRDFLQDMEALNLMVSEGDRHLSLAIPVGR